MLRRIAALPGRLRRAQLDQGAGRRPGDHAGRDRGLRRHRGHRPARLPARPDRFAAAERPEHVPAAERAAEFHDQSCPGPAGPDGIRGRPGMDPAGPGENSQRTTYHQNAQATAQTRTEADCGRRDAPASPALSRPVLRDVRAQPPVAGIRGRQPQPQIPAPGQSVRPGRQPAPADGDRRPPRPAPPAGRTHRQRHPRRHHQPQQRRPDHRQARAHHRHRLAGHRAARRPGHRLGGAPRPAADRDDGGPGRPHHRRRPDRPGQPARSRHRGRPPRDGAERDARQDRGLRRGARGQPGTHPALLRRCQPRTAQPAGLAARQRRALPARRTGRPPAGRRGDAAHRA